MHVIKVVKFMINAEETRREADVLLTHLRKAYPNDRFEVSPSGNVGDLKVECDATNMRLLMIQNWADGFMASAHLWER